MNKNSTVIKWQGSWKENAREEERESILFPGWILAFYLCCSPSWNLTKHSGNILSNIFKPPFASSLHLCHSCYSVCENATKDPVTWRTWVSGAKSEFEGVGAIPKIRCNPKDRKIRFQRSKDMIERYNRKMWSTRIPKKETLLPPCQLHIELLLFLLLLLLFMFCCCFILFLFFIFVFRYYYLYSLFVIIIRIFVLKRTTLKNNTHPLFCHYFPNIELKVEINIILNSKLRSISY